MEIEDSCSGSGSGVNSSDINMANSKELFLRGAVGGGGGGGVPKIDENNAMADDGSSNVKRLLTLLDQLDTQVENFRKEVLLQQDKKDAYLMSLEVIKNSELMNALDEYELEEIGSHLDRIGTRLATIDLSVKTIRNISQEDSLNQINIFIDSLIILPDKFNARQKCQLFLNCFDDRYHGAASPTIQTIVEESGSVSAAGTSGTASSNDLVEHFLDSPFLMYLSGCTLDDRKKIKKRLSALMSYLNKQTISD